MAAANTVRRQIDLTIGVDPAVDDGVLDEVGTGCVGVGAGAGVDAEAGCVGLVWWKKMGGEVSIYLLIYIFPFLGFFIFNRGAATLEVG